jgi:hypothetical protein
VRYRAFALFYRLLNDQFLLTKQNDLVDIENFLLTKKIFYVIPIIDLQALARQNAYRLGAYDDPKPGGERETIGQELLAGRSLVARSSNRCRRSFR